MTEQKQAPSGKLNETQDRKGGNPNSDRSKSTRPDSEGGDRHRNRRPSGSRKNAYRFEDQMEHAICQLVVHDPPQGFPVFRRSELATMPPVEVARTDSMILLCDHQHDGPHIWPNGDEVAT